jgi:hypothetical protein
MSSFRRGGAAVILPLGDSLKFEGATHDADYYDRGRID